MNRSQIGDNSTNWSQAKPSHGWTYNISKTRTPTVCHQHLRFFCYYGKPASAYWYTISPVCYWKGILMCRKPLVRTAAAHLALKKEWWFGVIQSHFGYPATKQMTEFLLYEPVVLPQVLQVQRHAQRLRSRSMNGFDFLIGRTPSVMSRSGYCPWVKEDLTTPEPWMNSRFFTRNCAVWMWRSEWPHLIWRELW